MTESNLPTFTKPELPMTIQKIREYLPHRYPFLLVDRVVDITDNGIVGYKKSCESILLPSDRHGQLAQLKQAEDEKGGLNRDQDPLAHAHREAAIYNDPDRPREARAVVENVDHQRNHLHFCLVSVVGALEDLQIADLAPCDASKSILTH